MKHLIIIYTFLFFITSLILAQNGERNNLKLGRDKNYFPNNTPGVWSEIYPQIPRVTYWGVTFVNQDVGLAVGEGGAIIKTTNGGQKWFWIESNIESTLKTISTLNNGTRFIAAGDAGKIIISEDGGETWNLLQSSTVENLWNMQMINDSIGWIVGEGATALKTTDGGLSWNQQITPYASLPFWDVNFIDALRGYICCNTGIVLKTIDGGNNWQILQAGDTRSLFTIYAFDSLWVSAAGFAGKAVYSTDGGNSWVNSGGNMVASESNKIKFINETQGYLVTSGGIFKSTDKGINWNSTAFGNTYMTTNISFPNDSVGHIVGSNMYLIKTSNKGSDWKKTIINDDFLNVYYKNENCGLINSSEFIYKTYDGGVTLDTLISFPYNQTSEFSGMLFIDSLVGYVGYNTIYKTIDGGLTWHSTNGAEGTVKKFFFINTDIGWAVGGPKIYKTVDGGENWVQQFTGLSFDYFTSVFFIDSVVGWATNINRRPFNTLDGGNTWIEQTNLNLYSTRDIYFANNNNGLCLEYNRFYETFDGGLNWNLDSTINGFLQGRFGYYDENNFFITGTKVFKTTNGGNEWIYYPELDSKSWQNSISLINAELGYLVGNTGLIYKYNEKIVPVELLNFDGKINENKVVLNWRTASELNNLGFEVQKRKWNENFWTSLSFVKGNGNSITINSYAYKDTLETAEVYFYRLKQIDFDGTFEYSDIIEVEINPPTKFSLEQNYPNPFNPSTKIRYQIPQDGIVTLKIYNILGSEVATLVNEEKVAGKYEVNFNASSLASGVYIYKIQAGDFISSKKMMLLK